MVGGKSANKRQLVGFDHVILDFVEFHLLDGEKRLCFGINPAEREVVVNLTIRDCNDISTV